MARPRQVVLLLRHGIAEAPSPGCVDEERRLTVEGARVLAEVAAGMRALALPVEAIVSSPLRRARETAAIVAAAFRVEDRIDALRALEPGAGPDAAIAALAAYREASGVLVVGHQPDLGEIASTILVGTPGLVPLPFGTAGLAGIAVTALPLRAPGVLEFFLTADQVCRIGRAVGGTG
jgi:phosphohistidine phosphatase